MFNPPILKYKKLKKGVFRNKELNKNSCTLQFGEYGLQFLHKGFLTPAQIEATRRILAKNIKGVGKL
jgi:ribosomal protein L16/L10AE